MPDQKEQLARSSRKGASASLLQYSSGYGYSAAGTAANEYGGGGGDAPAPKRRRKARFVLIGFLLPLAILGIWLLALGLDWVPPHRLPSPVAVWLAGVDLVERGTFGLHIAISLQRVLIGFVVGASIGLALGAVVGLSRWGSALIAPTAGALRAVPSLAWVPLLVLYVGINEDSKIALVAIGAFFPVYTTVAGSLRHVDHHLVELGRTYGLGRLALLTQVQLPAVVPSVVSGLRLALAQAWLFLVAAELIASSLGLGFLLTESGGNGRIDRMFLAIILLGILGKTTDSLIGVLERYLLRRWG